MASKKKEPPLQEFVYSQEEWDALLEKPLLYVVDAYAGWTGPTQAIVGFFRRIKLDSGDPLLNFACVDIDKVDALENYRGKCEPNFLIYGSGYLIGAVRGCNAPLLQTTIAEMLEIERKAQAGEIERYVIEENYEGTEPEPDDQDDEMFAGDDEEEDTDSLFDETQKQVTVGLIKPDVVSYESVQEIIEKVNAAGIEILQQIEVVLTEDEAKELYHEHAEETYFNDLVEYMCSGPVQVLAMTHGESGEGVVDLWREIMGPFDAAIAKKDHPNSLRAIYGTDAAINALHGSATVEAALRELAFFFPEFQVPTYMKLNPEKWCGSKFRRTKEGAHLERTLAIIRPDALRQFRGAVIDKIDELGLTIAMEKEILLTEDQAKAFYKKHKSEMYYTKLVKQMTSGPMLALCLTHEMAVNKWKAELGPYILEEVKKEKDCLRNLFHVEGSGVNMLHGSEDVDQAEDELGAFFQMDQSLLIVKPAAYEMRDKVIQKLEENGFIVSYQMTKTFRLSQIEELYGRLEDHPFYDDLCATMTKGPSLLVVVSAEDAVRKLRKLLGPTDPKRARRKEPNSLRAYVGYDILENGVHAVSNEKDAQTLIENFMGKILFDWDGYHIADELKAPTGVPDPTPRLRRLAPPEEPESEDEYADSVATDDDFAEDPGPLALIPPTPPPEPVVEEPPPPAEEEPKGKKASEDEEGQNEEEVTQS